MVIVAHWRITAISPRPRPAVSVREPAGFVRLVFLMEIKRESLFVVQPAACPDASRQLLLGELQVFVYVCLCVCV